MRSARWRSTASLVLVLALIAGGGAIGVLTARAATAKAVQVHRQDRLAFQAVVGKLIYGYFGAALTGLLERADTAGFALTPGDAGDVTRLKQIVDGSLFFSEGAVLTDLTGMPLSPYAPDGPLPPITDSGIAAPYPGAPAAPAGHVVDHDRQRRTEAGRLRRPRHPGRPRPSDCSSGSCGWTEPVRPSASSPRCRCRRGSTSTRSTPGARSPPASTRRTSAGPRRPGGPSRWRSPAAPGWWTTSAAASAYVDAYTPIGLGGWSLVVDEPSADFLDPILRGGAQVQILLIVLLVLAAAVVAVLHHRRQLALQQLADQALRDPLTGLPNRILFRSRLDASLTPASMPAGGVALLFCDLDGFKQINDGYGHAAGDELLVAVGERLRACVRETDLVARIGGDEFTVLARRRRGHPGADRAARRRGRPPRDRATGRADRRRPGPATGADRGEHRRLRPGPRRGRARHPRRAQARGRRDVPGEVPAPGPRARRDPGAREARAGGGPGPGSSCRPPAG